VASLTLVAGALPLDLLASFPLRAFVDSLSLPLPSVLVLPPLPTDLISLRRSKSLPKTLFLSAGADGLGTCLSRLIDVTSQSLDFVHESSWKEGDKD
jgi:hypothetical protein